MTEAKPNIDADLAWKFVQGQLSEQQYNYLVVTKELDREAMDRIVEFHRKGLRGTAFILTVVFWFVMVMIATWLGALLRG